MTWDAGLVARVADAVTALRQPGVRQKGVFGGRGFLAGRSAFVIVWGEDLIVKTAPDEYRELVGLPGVTPFAPGGEKPMSTWLVVSGESIADDPDLADWVRRGLRGIGR